VDTLFGPLCVRRNYYTDGQGGGRAPLDEALGMVEGCTPALARLMCRAGAVEHYEAAAASLNEYSGLTVNGVAFLAFPVNFFQMISWETGKPYRNAVW
jgi:hypothetical protein